MQVPFSFRQRFPPYFSFSDASSRIERLTAIVSMSDMLPINSKSTSASPRQTVTFKLLEGSYCRRRRCKSCNAAGGQGGHRDFGRLARTGVSAAVSWPVGHSPDSGQPEQFGASSQQ